MDRAKIASQSCLALAGAFLAMSSIAQSIEPTALSATEKAHQSALDDMLLDIANPQKSFNYVQSAVELGDLRGAIAALERMLLINPSLANIQLELGVLYLRLGNAPLARYHIAQALRAQNVPTVVRTRAERYLAAAGADSQRNFLRGMFSIGYRYDSNANSGPGSPFVTVYDPFLQTAVTAQLSANALKKSDSSLQTSGRLFDSYAFGGGNSWDSNLAFTGSTYHDLKDLNQWSVNLDTGPTIVAGATNKNQFQVRPYVAGGYSWIDGSSYLHSYGGGVSLRDVIDDRSIAALQLQLLRQDFQDLPTRLLSDRNGNYGNVDFSQTWQLGRTQIGLLVSGENAHAVTDYQSYNRYGGGLTARVYLGGGGTLAPWSIWANALRHQTNYKAPDPLIDPSKKRRDGRTDTIIGCDVPVSRYLSISVTGGYVDNGSNLMNFQYKDGFGGINLIAQF
jgi:hypothetical protein